MNTLYARLSLGLTLLLVVIGMLYAAINAFNLQRYTAAVNQQLHHHLARELVADRNLVAAGRLDQNALAETFHQYMVINPSIEIYLLDLEGRILSYSADPGVVKRLQVDLGPIRQFLTMDSPSPLMGDDPRSHGMKKAFSVTPVPNAEQPEGYLYVILRGEQFERVETLIQSHTFLRQSGWALLISLGCGLLFGLLLFRLLTRRLQQLSTSMAQFQPSTSGRTIEVNQTHDQDDEIDRLSHTFKQMSQRIAQQIEQLQQQDTQRRQLIAQISHDLRTPLASIQGYLETLILQDGELTSERRLQFIQIALRQGQQMGQLIESLFELARLDAQEQQPSPEPFVLADLLSDVVHKYHLRAQQQGVTLTITPPVALPFAFGDVALTERVLDNLLENALTYTPTNGTIQLVLATGDGVIKCCIIDSGPGIAPDQLPHIFEPFMRAAPTLQRHNHAGLGLAIVKRILELQHGSIHVSSSSQGSHFCFCLPIAPA